ncbi:unnamed protein product [Leptidea sinapis]|uniref:Osiris 18 n=1 Tax=Leptidea sinapis TaxID=189913 RepID=A0A5E4PXY9_9NEOP|nr:unnamed protein product [Leptidea sinapis]
MFKFVVLLSVVALASGQSASGLVRNIYDECLSQYSVECVKPRTFEWIARVSNDDEIKITDNLSIIKTAIAEDDEDVDPRMAKDPSIAIIDSVDRFIQTHSVRVQVPDEIAKTAASGYVPRSLFDGLPSELDMPLDGEEEVETVEGRKKKIKLPKPLRIKSKHGFIKKVVLPFLLGLKFKASVLVPLALALIALKTWKALTLGLISLVLSVIHYPQHHVEHHVDHHAPGWDSHGPYQARSYEDAHEIAYAGQI